MDVGIIGGVPVHRLSLHEAAGTLLTAAAERRPVAVHLCNAYVISLAARDGGYRQVLSAGDVNLADGAPVAWTLRRLGLPLGGPRPSGSELFVEMFSRSSDLPIKHYLYGSSPTVIELLLRVVTARWKTVGVVGAESPPYRPLSDDEYQRLVSRLRTSGATVVWIGTGTPRQDLLVERLRHDVDAVLVPIGAAFDFLAGTKPRAPRWMRRLGIEWVHRLVSEPRRLWKRYLVGNSVFVLAAIRARRGRPGPSKASGQPLG